MKNTSGKKNKKIYEKPENLMTSYRRAKTDITTTVITPGKPL